MNAVDVVISVADNHLKKIGGVLKQARAAGLEGGMALKEIGIITGKAAPDQIERLRGLSGVASVEVGKEYRLPPPESSIQ